MQEQRKHINDSVLINSSAINIQLQLSNFINFIVHRRASQKFSDVTSVFPFIYP
uniref:Uncharacterized protein n=1 Tax=Romanomermis culicivorax TaxID=13658 RepID=A0A915IP28_ROMCU